jgi:hypothetical protein
VGDTEYLAERTAAITVVPVNDPEKVVSAIKDHMRTGPLPEESVLIAQSFIDSISWEKQSLQTREVFNVIMEVADNKN